MKHSEYCQYGVCTLSLLNALPIYTANCTAPVHKCYMFYPSTQLIELESTPFHAQLIPLPLYTVDNSSSLRGRGREGQAPPPPQLGQIPKILGINGFRKFFSARLYFVHFFPSPPPPQLAAAKSFSVFGSCSHSYRRSSYGPEQ